MTWKTTAAFRTTDFLSEKTLKLVMPVLLALLAAPPAARSDNCVSPPAGMVSFWPGNGTSEDVADGNSGSLAGNAGFLPGKVGQAFVFDGDQDGVLAGTAVNLQLQDLTIEGWIKRASASVISFGGNGSGSIFGIGGGVYAGGGGYGFYLKADSILAFGKLQANEVTANASITDTTWHHVAVTKSGTTVVFYVDGVAYSAPAYDSGGFTFSAPGYIGTWLNPYGLLDNSFYGMIDELAIYARGLSSVEVQAIYQAGSQGKCVTPVAPTIQVQPTNQTAMVTTAASFSVWAAGTAPLSYQWNFGEMPISGATDSTLTLPSVQFTNVGIYWVLVTNSAGWVASTNVRLTVLPIPSCTAAPTGLISWWQGEANALDAVSGNYGLLGGDSSFGPGRTGQGFVFDGSGDAVQLGNPANLRLQNLTIEAWVKRASSTVSSLAANEGCLLACGSGGFGFTIMNNGNLTLSRLGVDSVVSATSITDTSWHHVAVTRSGSTVVFYVDGIAYPVAAYNPAFTFTTTMAIGARGDNLGYSFYGSIDEIAVYNRALSGPEIQAIYTANLSGKCVAPFPTVIVAHPQSTNVLVGTNITLSVVAGGSMPLSYQWRFNGTNINNATSASFTINNIDFVHVGPYAVQVSNIAGTVVSSNANVSVTFPTPVVRVGSTSLMAGGTFTLPVTLAANGNENFLGFSLNFSTQRLAFVSAALGGGATGATLFVNTSLIATGRLGIAVARPAQSTFARGTQEVVRVTFKSWPLLGTTTTTITSSFADQPVLRELYGTQFQPLSASYSNGTVVLLPTVFESDVSPRTNGNQAVSAADWVQVGRFVARLDTPIPTTNEFQRADCAPRATAGDGQFKVTDWVQAGRYLAGLDPLAAIGGPTSETAPTFAGSSSDRQLRVLNNSILQAQACAVSVNLEAQGDENAVGFTLAFDPSAFTFSGVMLGSGAVGGNLVPNLSQVANGKLGVVLALPAGGAFQAGTREIVSVNFTGVPSATGVFPMTLNDQLVTRCISDGQAAELAVTYFSGTVKVSSTNPPPALKITQSAGEVTLSWPLWAANFTLQAAGNLPATSGDWTNLSVTPVTDSGEAVVRLPVTGEAKFYRLFLP